MKPEYTFYDYFDADSSRVNVIQSWLNGAGAPAKAFFTIMIANLEVSHPPGARDSVWKEPYVKHMKGEWKGFIELRRQSKGVQYRLLGFMRNRHVFLVAYGTHKDQHYDVNVSPATALSRIAQMETNPAKYAREHRYD